MLHPRRAAAKAKAKAAPEQGTKRGRGRGRGRGRSTVANAFQSGLHCGVVTKHAGL